MIKPEMSNESIEQFIRQFLPEGKLIHNQSLELMSVSQLIGKVFNVCDTSTTVEQVFNTFYKLDYPMSVEEPVHEGKKLSPYITTNSNVIYIAIDLDNLSTTNRLLEILDQQEPVIPFDLKDVHNAYQLFLIDINR